MKVNNKGMTIIEVLISVCIIAIVLILLFSLLLQVRAEDRDNNIQSNFILHQSVIIKAVEEDILDFGLKSISECNLINSLPQSEVNTVNNVDNSYCIQFGYGKGSEIDSYGYLMLYQYKLKWKVVNGETLFDDEATNASPWMIRYQRGDFETKKVNSNGEFVGERTSKTFSEKSSVMKELPADIITNNVKPYVKFTSVSGKNNGLLVMPIITDTGEHYDIDISFTYNLLDNESTFYCHVIGNKANQDFCVNMTNSTSLIKHDYYLKAYSSNEGKAMMVDMITVDNINQIEPGIINNNTYLKTFAGINYTIGNYKVADDSTILVQLNSYNSLN